MKLPRNSFYYKPKLQSPERMEVEADLRDKIEAICLEYSRYGYRRVTHELRYRGCHVNHKKVLKIMRESDLLCRVRRRRVKTTDSKHHFPRYSNLIKGMVISHLNQVGFRISPIFVSGRASFTWRRYWMLIPGR